MLLQLVNYSFICIFLIKEQLVISRHQDIDVALRIGNSVCDLQDTGQNDIEPRNGAGICKGDAGIHAQCRPNTWIDRETEILHGHRHKHRVQQPETKRFSPCYMDASRYAAHDLVLPIPKPPLISSKIPLTFIFFGVATGEKRRKMEEEKGIIIRFVIGHRLVRGGTKMYFTFLHANKNTMTFSWIGSHWLTAVTDILHCLDGQ